ncbi:MAG: D-aminoacyl-tRNA deacylase [Balneolales bacterium]
MKVVVQRVSEASVKIDDKVSGSIKRGLLLFIAVHRNDSDEQMKWVADKCCRLRIFEDENGKMNRSIEDVGGKLLIVSQFTLYGKVAKGSRPSFIHSAGSEKAEKMYHKMIAYMEKTLPGKIQTGVFAANMKVSLVNDGPVTIIIER